MVDQAVHNARARRPVAHDPHPRAHGRDHKPHHPHLARDIPGTRREPSPEQIAARLHLPVEKIKGIQKITREPISLETPVGEDEDSSLGDFIEDKSHASPLQEAINEDLCNKVQKLLNTLNDKEAMVLRRRFGIGDDSPLTLEEIGQEFEVTRERIRQIEVKALKKLKHPARRPVARDFLDSN